MPSTNPSNDDRDLDQLLGMARWPEPKSDQLGRLCASWRTLRVTRSRRRRVLATVFAAAAVLLVAIGWTAWWRTGEREVEIAALKLQPATTDATLPENVRPADGGSIVASNQSHDTREIPLVQSPSLYERVALIEAMPPTPRRATNAARERRGQSSAIARRQRRTTAPWKAPVAARILATARRGGEIVGGLVAQQYRLRQAIDQGAVDLVARAAARIERAATLARNSSPHGKAVEDVIARGSVREVTTVLVREPEPDFRRRLLVELLTRWTSESVESYLNFVANPVSRDEAIAAVAAASHVPSDMLLAYLRSPRVPQRYAAALALARTSDAAVIDALAGSLADAESRQQALVALLLSPNARAAEIVDRAREDLYLVASVRAAEFDLHRLTETPTR